MNHLNINSLRNRFELIKEVFYDNIDVLFLSETKLDETFPNNQFQIEDWKFQTEQKLLRERCLYVYQPRYGRKTCWM